MRPVMGHPLVDWTAFAVGVVVLGATALSVLWTLVVPRATPSSCEWPIPASDFR